MKLLLTWSNGNTEIIEGSKESLESLMDFCVDRNFDGTHSQGNTITYNIKHIRKLEILD